MSLPYARWVLACLPILKGSACTNTNKEWQAQRCTAIYHSAMAHIIPEISEICSKNHYYRFAYKLVRHRSARAAVFGICCAWMVWRLQQQPCVAQITVLLTPTCECPKTELDNPEDTYQLRHTESVRKEVEQARAKHLNADGTIKDNHKERVCCIVCILHVI